MTKGSDNSFPSVLFGELGSAPATPAAGKWRLYTKSDGLYIVDDAGNSTGPFSVGGASFNDAEGDPAVVSNTAAADGTSSYAARRDHAHLRSAFVGARYTSNAAQSIINNAAAAIVNFEDQVYDTGSLVTTGASWKFTAPTTGYYHLDCLVAFAASAGWAAVERAIIYLYVDGALVATLDRIDDLVANTTAFLSGSCTFYMAASSYCDVRTQQNSGGDISLDSNPANVWINIEGVG